MQFTAQDIILRHSNQEPTTAWLSQQLLCHYIGKDISTYLRVSARPAYLKSVAPSLKSRDFLPDTGKAWRWAYFNGKFYYAYDNIPNAAPSYYANAIPSKKELVQLQQQLQQQQPHNLLSSFIISFVEESHRKYFVNYGHNKQSQQIALAKAAAFVDGAKVFISQTNTSNTPASNHIFKQLSTLIAPAGADYLPSHYKNLKKLIQKGINGTPTIELVKLKREGNTNALVHSNDDEVKSWILNMRIKGENFTNAYIIRKIQWLCSISDKAIPSDRWIGEQMETTNMDFLTALGRYGSKGRYAQDYRGHTPFANALNAGDCWQLDGSRVNLVNFKQKVTITNNETGKEHTLNKEQFITVVAVRDVHSGYILGYSYNISENRWSYIEALKMAVKTAGYLPYEIVFDKFPGHNTQEFENFANDLKELGVKIKFTYKATGKAKMERWFGTLQTVFMQDSKYFYGEGIQSKNNYAHRSKEYLKEIRKIANQEGWDFDKAADEATDIITAYNNTKYSHYSRKFKNIDNTPAEVHELSEKPDVIEIEADQYNYLFGYKRTAKIAHLGLIDFEVKGVTFNYRCNNYDVVSKYNEVLVCYMLEDMSTIHLYQISNKKLKLYLGIATEIKDIIPYGKQAFEGYGKEKAIIAQMNDFRNQELEYKAAIGYNSMSILEQGFNKKYAYDEADAQATIAHITGSSFNPNENEDFDENEYLRNQL